MVSRRERSSYQCLGEKGNSVSSGQPQGSGSHEQQCHGCDLPEIARRDHDCKYVQVSPLDSGMVGAIHIPTEWSFLSHVLSRVYKVFWCPPHQLVQDTDEHRDIHICVYSSRSHGMQARLGQSKCLCIPSICSYSTELIKGAHSKELLHDPCHAIMATERVVPGPSGSCGGRTS